MIVDAFMYYNEDEVAEVRLNELKGVVDKFIVVRGTTTFRGNPNPHAFPDHLRWDNVEVHDVDIPLRTPRTGIRAWEAEYYLRRYPQSLFDQYDDNDRFIFSDCDEIPSGILMEQFKDGRPGIFGIDMDRYYYNFRTWIGGTNATFTCLKREVTDLQPMRHASHPVLYGGWELSCFGDAPQIQDKIKNFSHWELDVAKYTDIDQIQARIDEGRDIIDRPLPEGSPKYGIPQYVINNRERFGKWLTEHK